MINVLGIIEKQNYLNFSNNKSWVNNIHYDGISEVTMVTILDVLYSIEVNDNKNPIWITINKNIFIQHHFNIGWNKNLNN